MATTRNMKRIGDGAGGDAVSVPRTTGAGTWKLSGVCSVLTAACIGLASCSSSGGGGLTPRADEPAQFDHMGALTRFFVALMVRDALLDDIAPAIDELIDDAAGLFPAAENPESIDCPAGSPAESGNVTRELLTEMRTNPFAEPPADEDFDIEQMVFADCQLTAENLIDGFAERGLNSAASGGVDDVTLVRAGNGGNFSVTEQDGDAEHLVSGEVTLFRVGGGAGEGRMFLEAEERQGGQLQSRAQLAFLPAGGGQGLASTVFAVGDSVRILIDRRSRQSGDCIAPGRFDMFLGAENTTIVGGKTAIITAEAVGPGALVATVNIDGEEKTITLTAAEVIALRAQIEETCLGE